MSKVQLSLVHDGEIARVALAAPKANIVDSAMMEELKAALQDLKNRPGVRAMVLASEGPHFSFGASVEEHLPEQVGSMLPRFHDLLRNFLDLPLVTVAAVRGQCLGGGFELVLACDFIIAEEGAAFGCPEIKLAVFPPAAAALLPVRMGASRAAELILTGASWTVSQAAAAGLVVRTAPAGELQAATETWIGEHILPHSAATIRHAVRAARLPLQRALHEDLPILERRYLEELMTEPDALEGLRAFLEKRPPRWSKKRDAV